jgi:hypothetical protein
MNNKSNKQVTEIITQAVRRFKKLSARTLPIKKFGGFGVYALYYKGSNRLYSHYRLINEGTAKEPIFVGKAVPKNWVLDIGSNDTFYQGSDLYSRITEQCNSICQAKGLNLKDFRCRYMVLTAGEVLLAEAIEKALINQYSPLWNTCIDGFSSHNPGKGRMKQAKSDWDVIHPGRAWAESLQGKANDEEALKAKIKSHIKEIGLV